MDDRHKANGARLSQLLIDKGTEAMRKFFDSIHPPTTLTATLNSYRSLFKKKRFINTIQMDILFPPSGTPSKSEDYDITLLFILLRNICGLHPPAVSGWDKEPPSTDVSKEAHLARIKYYRNIVYGHITSTAVDDSKFLTYWDDISNALIGLGVDAGEIGVLKTAPLEQDVYFQQIKDWKEKEEKLEVRLQEIQEDQKKMKEAISNITKNFTILLLVSMLTLVIYYNPLKETQNFKQSIDESTKSSIDFSSHLKISNADFVGRKWLFQELEDIFNRSHSPPGVIILGDPGSGKSAIMSQLISSPSSSLFIHENIIGYHLCKFDEKRTRDGARFVQTLVDLFTENIPEFSRIIQKESIQNELKIECKDDPIGCFHSVILAPIRDLNNQQNSMKFILVDALDECLERDGQSSTILDILQGIEITRFPDWIKLILSSRNKTSLITKLPKTIERLAINSRDKRNLEDIRSYIEHMLQNKKASMKKDLNRWIEQLFKIGEGNFLYFKTLLEYLNKHSEKIDLQSFPPTLHHLYASSFRNRFGKSDFERFTPLLEILLALNSPLNMTELDAVLKFQNNKYDTHKLVKQVSAYLSFGSDETIRFYHQSFANWLMNQTEDTDGLSVQKSRGHQYITDYRFDYFHQRNVTLTLQELSKLSMHVLFGGMLERQVSKLKALNVSKIWDSRTKGCILHDLAHKKESTPIIEIFLEKFDSVDILDKREWTPAFYAAHEGNFQNLKLFIEKGTDINYVAECPNCSYEPEYVFAYPKRVTYYDSSIILIAAQLGHLKIAELLIKNEADFDKANKFGRKPLHLASENGHLDVVKLFYENGAIKDVIALHHAAARNHSDIVRFLLKNIGIRDECLPCKPGNISSCYTTRNLSLNQSHLCFCETALHAAVSRGLLNIVKLLLSYGKDTLECVHHSGKTSLLDAVERNDTEMVTLLLEKGANVEVQCENEISNKITNRYKCQNSLFDNEANDLYTRYCSKDVCSCGSRAIHLCARHGLWEMAKELIFRWHAKPFSTNCMGLSAVSFAAIHDRADFIHNFDTIIFAGAMTKYSDDIMRYIVVCGSRKTLKLLSSIGNNRVFATVYDDGMTLLHLATLWSPYPTPHASYYTTRHRKIESCSEKLNNDACLFPNKTCFSPRHISNEYKKRLMTVKLLTKLQQNIDKKDKHGRTALHYAATFGFAGAVRHLVRQGSNWRIKDKTGNTPLALALKESPFHSEFFLPCRMTSDRVFQSCNSTIFDETVSYLIMLQKSTFKECDAAENKNLMVTLLIKNMPLSLYSLFKIGVNVNCTPELFTRHLTLAKIGPDLEVNEVLKIFEVNVNIECGVPFNRSQLHLMAHFGTPYDIGNFFKPSVNNKSFPLQRYINNNPNGFQVFDKCRDEEGYLAIHRAVQGGNVDAVNWFISLGVNISKKTTSGWTALDLSIYYLVPERYSRIPKADYKYYSFLEHFFFIHKHHNLLYLRITLRDSFSLMDNLLLVQKLRGRIFEKLLAESLKTIEDKGSISFSWCKPEFTELSPLHVAASRGMEMLTYVKKKAPRLPLSCTNKHGIEPWYLAYVYESVEDKEYNRKIFLQSFDPLNQRRSLQYPERNAEYHLIYNQFFQTPEVDLSFELDFEGLFVCPGINGLLPKRTVIEKQITRCYNRCWKIASKISNRFLSLFHNIPIENDFFDLFGDGFLDVFEQMTEFRYRSVKMFYKIPSSLWRQVSRAYFCSHRCRCLEIMNMLQEQFTSLPRGGRRVGKFVAERMGWNDTSVDGDVMQRWPFIFFLEKALKKYKAYDYLKILSEDLEYLFH